MKQVTDAMDRHLNRDRHFRCADVYELQLRNGGTYFFTDSDADIVYEGNLYVHNRFIIERTQIKTNSRVMVDKLVVTVFSDRSDKIEGKTVQEFAHDGGFDGARLFLRRVFFDDDGSPFGHVALFGGIVEVSNAGGMELKFNVKAETQGLHMFFPLRRYYPETPYGTIAGKDSGTALVAPFVPSSLSLF